MTTQHYLKRQRRKRKRHSYRRPKRPFFRRRSGRTLIAGIIVGAVGALLIYLFVGSDLADALPEWSPPSVSVGEPPTQEEVQHRAEALGARGIIVAFGSMLCPKAPGLLADAEGKMNKRFSEVNVEKAMRLDSDGAAYLTSLPDPRTAMQVMDEIEGLYDDLERNCM